MNATVEEIGKAAEQSFEALISPPNTEGRPFLKTWIDFTAPNLRAARAKAPDEARNFGGGGYSRVLKVRKKKDRA